VGLGGGVFVSRHHLTKSIMLIPCFEILKMGEILNLFKRNTFYYFHMNKFILLLHAAKMLVFIYFEYVHFLVSYR